MSSRTEQLERAAAEERELLGEHLDQLQQKLEKALDPAVLYDRHPLPILATALVGGVILGAVTRSDGPSRRQAAFVAEDEPGRVRSQRSGMVHDGLAQLRGALIGMLFAKIAEKVAEFTASDEPTVPTRQKRSTARPADRDSGGVGAMGHLDREA